MRASNFPSVPSKRGRCYSLLPGSKILCETFNFLHSCNFLQFLTIYFWHSALSKYIIVPVQLFYCSWLLFVPAECRRRCVKCKCVERFTAHKSLLNYSNALQTLEQSKSNVLGEAEASWVVSNNKVLIVGIKRRGEKQMSLHDATLSCPLKALEVVKIPRIHKHTKITSAS